MNYTEVELNDGKSYFAIIWYWKPKEGWFSLDTNEDEVVIHLADVKTAMTHHVVNVEDLLVKARSEGWDGVSRPKTTREDMITELGSKHPKESVTLSQMFKIQDHHFRVAQKILLEEGNVDGMAFFFVAKTDIAGICEKGFQVLAEGGDVSAAETVILGMPTGFNWEIAFAVLRKRSTDAQKDVLDAILQTGINSFGDNAFMHTTRPLMKVLDLNEKDVMAMVIEDSIKMANAYAWMKVDEIWMRATNVNTEGKTPEEVVAAHKKSLEGKISGHPDAVEGIAAILETKSVNRSLLREFVRDPREPGGKGPIIGFKPVEEIINERSWVGALGGRFNDLLEAEKLSSTKA